MTPASLISGWPGRHSQASTAKPRSQLVQGRRTASANMTATDDAIIRDY